MEAQMLIEMPSSHVDTIFFNCENSSLRSKIEKTLPIDDKHRFVFSDMTQVDTLLFPRTNPKMLVEYHEGEKSLHRALNRINIFRAKQYQGLVAVLTDDPNVEDLVHSLYLGVDEYLYNGPRLKLLVELRRILAAGRETDTNIWSPEKIGRIGLFRSLGLTPLQIKLLTEYSRDFPRLRVLSRRTNINETSVRKAFSQIYSRLRGPLAIENQSQLAQLITICACVGPLK